MADARTPGDCLPEKRVPTVGSPGPIIVRAGELTPEAIGDIAMEVIGDIAMSCALDRLEQDRSPAAVRALLDVGKYKIALRKQALAEKLAERREITIDAEGPKKEK